MSSEQEEGADHLDEPNANFDANVDQSEDQKGNGLREHAKPRRRRRGKKRKQKKESAATCEAENPEECESELHAESEHEIPGDDSPEWGSDESLSCNYDAYTDVIIRPVNVPMAPLNSTQFIMDDHDDCRFYMSFETPNHYGFQTECLVDREQGDIIEPLGEDAAYIDIDYQYESPQDFDNSAYYDKEFELSYKTNRFEELMRLSRTDLLDRLQTLESRLKELSEDLVKENPSPILEQLQDELLNLQEKNSYLKECNSKLTTALLQNEPHCSETLTCSTLGEDMCVSHKHDLEDSEGEVCEECGEPAEVIMSDINPNPNSDTTTIDEACDKNSGVQFGSETDDHHNEENSDRQINHKEESNQLIEHLEDTNQLICHNDGDLHKQQEQNEKKVLSNKSESEACMLSNAGVNNSEDKKSKLIHSNSHVMLCQSNNIISDDLRTLNITSSELYRISNQTKCSSLVPREGGMSPSETSVN